MFIMMRKKTATRGAGERKCPPPEYSDLHRIPFLNNIIALSSSEAEREREREREREHARVPIPVNISLPVSCSVPCFLFGDMFLNSVLCFSFVDLCLILFTDCYLLH